MPLQATSGAASYDAFGGGVPVVPAYIEEVFSTYLYSGNGSTQTITNNLDLSGKGGLTWIKCRNSSTPIHIWVDSARGNTKAIYSNATSDQYSEAGLTTLTSSGFSVGQVSTSVLNVNATSQTYSSWSFAKAPKFFDVVTFTGNGTAGRTVAHSLGSVPGCMIVKRTDASNGWAVYHRSMNASPQNYMMRLNATTEAFTSSPSRWNDTLPTSTEFTLSGNDEVNGSGGTYVAYLFAHDAGGFGLTGTDNVISCGSYTGTGSALSVTLGYEPQWVMIKRTDTTADWQVIDNMRGWTADGVCQRLVPNTSAAEAGPTGSTFLFPTATGFGSGGSSAIVNASGGTYIYIAIRRGPMKVPTSGTSVFSPNTTTNDNNVSTTGFPVDMFMEWARDGSSNNAVIGSRLTGSANALVSSSTAAEAALLSGSGVFSYNTGVATGVFASAVSAVQQNFQRAPSFFDSVCYTGTGTTTTQTHNLQVVPELIIVKRRSGVAFWQVYSATYGRDYYAFLNDTQGFASDPGNAWGTTNPTSTTFSLSPTTETNASGSTYVAYLFATCAGVSKVGSYTGNGSTQTIDCGFGAGGARFVLIKRADASGGWYVYDTARGMTVLTDPYLFLNNTAAETATLGSVTTVSTGFALNSSILAAINVSGGTYIFLAIA